MLLSAIPTAVGAFASRLRFPQLFFVTAALFLVDLLIPDLIPFVDELLLGLMTVLFGMWQHKTQPPATKSPAKPPMKDVTPASPTKKGDS